MKKWIALCLALLCAGLLCACQGKPLPDGMSEDTLLQRGQEVLLELVEGDYDAVYGYLRPDVAADTSPEEIQALALRPARLPTASPTAWRCCTASSRRTTCWRGWPLTRTCA